MEMLNAIDFVKYTSISDLRRQIAYDVITNDSSITTSSFDLSDTIIKLIIQLQKQTSLFQGRGFIKLLEHSDMERHKLIETIKTLLLRFGDFKSFIQINNIEDSALLDAISNGKLIKVDNGAYLFKEGDDSKGVIYCVLKGKISLRKKQLINKHSNDSLYFNKKKKIQDKGSNIKNTKNNENNNNETPNKTSYKRASVRNFSTKELKLTTKKLPNLNVFEHIKVSPFKRKDILNPGTTVIKKEYLEVNLLTKTEGYCIIDTFLMDEYIHQQNTISVFCLDDTYFLRLQGSTMKCALSRNIAKLEHQKRTYLRTHFLPLNEITSDQFDILYSFIIVKYYSTPNHFVFLQNSDINTITIIYSGQFALNSNGKNIIKLKNRVILGLESIFTDDYSVHKTFPKYKYSLLSEYSGEVGMIMQIKRELIPEFLIDPIKKKFQNYYETFTSTIDNLLEQKMKVEKARSGFMSVNKSLFQSMNENQKCETAIDIYFKLAVNDIVPDSKGTSPLKAVIVSQRKQILKDFTIRKRILKKHQEISKQSSGINISNGLIEGNILYRNIKNNSVRRENKSYCNSNRKEFSFSTISQLRKDVYNKNSFSNDSKSLSKEYSHNTNITDKKQTNSFHLNHSNSSGLMSIACSKLKEKLNHNFSFVPIKKSIFEHKASPKLSYNSGNFNLPFVSKIIKNEVKDHLNCSC